MSPTVGDWDVEFPDRWGLERDGAEGLDEKLGPFSDMEDWQEQHRNERDERLGTGGYRLYAMLDCISEYMWEYDMTPEEAVQALEYEIERYKENNE